jgi:hypothetical protein
MSALEDRYRRLLRWYPAEHRRLHEEEMLGVLLAAAGPQRSRPSVRDVVDLMLGGLGIRIRRAPRTLARAGWRDAAALLSVVAPLVLLADAFCFLLEEGVLAPEHWHAAHHGVSWIDLYLPPLHRLAPFRLLWGVAGAVALCGARRLTAIAVLAAMAADLGGLFWFHQYAGGMAAVPVLLGLVTVAAMTAGPGVARGRELLGRSALIGVIALLAVTAPLNSPIARTVLGIEWGDRRLIMVVAAVVAAIWLARSAAGRRAVIVLAALLYPVVAPVYPGRIDALLTRYLVAMVVIPAVIALVALMMVTALERLIIRPLSRRPETTP